MAQSIAFLGLGSMGTPMARNLLRAGYSLFVYNRTQSKADELVAEGAKLIHKPAEAFQKADIVMTMLSNDKALEEVTQELLSSIKTHSIHVSLSTVSPDTSRKLELLHQKKGAYFVASPVFGRPDVAAAAKLWICVAGNPEAKKQIEPILKNLGQRIEDFGDAPEKANIVKLAGNFLILSALEAIGEALSLAEKNGIDRKKMAQFFSETLFPSPVYKTYGNIIAENHYLPAGFKASLGLKDMTLVNASADASHVPMPLAELLHRHLEQAVAQGKADWDWSSLWQFSK